MPTRIVLCDDHTLLTESLAASLTAKGYQVEAVTSTPAQGLAAVASLDPDILMLDVHFPMTVGHRSGPAAGGEPAFPVSRPNSRMVTAGLELAQAVLERHPRTKVLMVSATDDPAIVSAALDLGVSGFTRKDQRIDGIVQILERVAAGEVAVDPELLRAAVRHLKAPDVDQAERTLRYLTPREREVLRRIVEGESTKQIARAMDIAQSTARTHVQNVLVKLGAHSRVEASAIVARVGAVERLGVTH
ncbi:MAG: LuxR C-terminal-related transcriptional regulator [Catenulispora sp.]